MFVACCDEPHWLSTVVAAAEIGQTGGEPRGAGDVEALHADLADTAADHLADLGRIDAGPVDQLLLHDGERIRRVERRHAAAATPDRGTDRFDDDDFVAAELSHGGSLFLPTELRGETGALAPNATQHSSSGGGGLVR